MRLLRALGHLILALAVVAGAFAQAEALASAPMRGAADQRAAVVETHSDHHQDHSTGEAPVHKSESCRTACCFFPVQLPPVALRERAAELFCSVRYVLDVEPASGRAFAPDPGIPKRVS